MRLKLLRQSRIRHEAGEIVEVSPAEANYLLSTKSAVVFAEEAEKIETPEQPAPVKTTRTRKKG